MLRLMCDITPTDELHVYTTAQEKMGYEHLAVVMVQPNGNKISVLLTREQAIILGNVIQDFIQNGHQE